MTNTPAHGPDVRVDRRRGTRAHAPSPDAANDVVATESATCAIAPTDDSRTGFGLMATKKSDESNEHGHGEPTSAGVR